MLFPFKPAVGIVMETISIGMGDTILIRFVIDAAEFAVLIAVMESVKLYWVFSAMLNMYFLEEISVIVI